MIPTTHRFSWNSVQITISGGPHLSSVDAEIRGRWSCLIICRICQIGSRKMSYIANPAYTKFGIYDMICRFLAMLYMPDTTVSKSRQSWQSPMKLSVGTILKNSQVFFHVFHHSLCYSDITISITA